MKKTILLAMVLQWAIVSPAFSMVGEDPVVKEIKTEKFTSIVINADVKVELRNSSEGTVLVEGDQFFMENIHVEQKGNSLIISATRRKNFKNRGTIYIPAAALRYMEVNSAAHVSSTETLAIPLLDVLVNGSCQLHIVNKGKLNLSGSRLYAVGYVMRDGRYPFRVLEEHSGEE